MSGRKPRVRPIKIEEILDPTDKEALQRFSDEIMRKSLVAATDTQPALFEDKYNLSTLVPAGAKDTTIGKGSKDAGEKGNGRLDVAAGLAYRRELPVLLYAFSQSATVENRCTAEPPRRDECTILGSWLLEIPNSSPIEVLPAKSGLFVQTDLKFEFDQGMLISHDAVRPSEIARVAALPVEYAMSILEIPAKIIQLRVNLGTQQTALTTNETAAITAEIARLEALQRLDEARKAEDDKEASGE